MMDDDGDDKEDDDDSDRDWDSESDSTWRPELIRRRKSYPRSFALLIVDSPRNDNNNSTNTNYKKH